MADRPEKRAQRLRDRIETSVVAKGGANSDWGVSKLPDIVATMPNVVVVEFAVNDALSSGRLSIDLSRASLSKIAAAVSPATVVFVVANQASGVRTQARPRRSEYYSAVGDLAKSSGVKLVEPDWSSRPMNGAPDGLHPSHDVAVDLLVPQLADAIDPQCSDV